MIFPLPVRGRQRKSTSPLLEEGLGGPQSEQFFLNRRLSRRFKKKTSSAFFAPPAKRAVNFASAKRVMG
jgi:hypothetical protein